MKNVIYFLLVVFGLSFTGCLDDDENKPIYYSYTTYIKDNSSKGYFLNMDGGGKIIPSNSFSAAGLDDSSRVIVNYQIVSETGKDTSLVVMADISSMEKILTKNIIQLTDEIKDSIGNDGTICYDYYMWLSENHLNVIFYFYGYNQYHLVNLVKPIGQQTDENGNQILQFKHNRNNDWENYLNRGIVSFNLESLYESGLDSISFVFQAMNYDSSYFNYYNTYHFKNKVVEQTAVLQCGDFYNKLE